MKICHGEKMKMLFYKMTKQIFEQQLDSTNKISKLKEIESKEKETCKCVGCCAINQNKHSWKSSPSNEFYTKFQKLTN